MKNTQMNRICSILLLIGMGLVIPFLIFTVLNCCLSGWSLYNHNRPVLCFLVLGGCLAGMPLLRWIRSHDISDKTMTRLTLIITGIFFLAQFCSALLLRHTPFTDTEQIVTAAINLANTGAFETSERSYIYFSRYPFNLGSVYLYALIIRIAAFFGYHDTYMIIAVSLMILFSVGLLCGTGYCRRASGNRSGFLFLLLCFFCFPLYYCPAELYTDTFAISFPPMLLYTMQRAKEAEEKKNWRQIVLFILLFSGIASIGVRIRMTTIIPFIACLIAVLFWRRLMLFVSMLLAGLLLIFCSNQYVEHLNVQHLGAENLRVHRLSVWHYFAMGLPIQEDEGYGDYGYGGWLVYSTSFDDPDERDAELRLKVKDKVYAMRYPSQFLSTMSRKNFCTFGDGAFNLNQAIEADEHEVNNPLKAVIYADGPGYPAYDHIATAIFYIQMIIAVSACIQAIRRKDTRSAPVYIAILGVFLYLACWEANPRYFFSSEFLLLIAAAQAAAIPEGFNSVKS